MLTKELINHAADSRNHLLQLVESIFNNTDNGIILTDTDQKILTINQAFTLITGYSEDELKGKSPRVLKSGQHDINHYKIMWDEIINHGFWQGVMTNRKKDGSLYTEWLTVRALKDDNNITSHYLGIMQNLSLHEEKMEIIKHLKVLDSATSLLNRNAAVQFLSDLEAEDKKSLFLGVIDIDHFYFINEKFGTGIGDQIIKKVAIAISEHTVNGEKLARIGADKFLLIGQMQNHKDLMRRLGQIRTLISRSYSVNGTCVDISVSLGVELGKNQPGDVSVLIRNAEQALIQGRKIGYGRVHAFEWDKNNVILDEIHLARELGLAFDNQQLELYYQPKASMSTGRISSAEALIRWNHPVYGVMAPDRFIPLAERFGLIHRLGQWVLEEACRQLNRWKKTPFSGFRIAVNMSVQQLMDPRFLDSLKLILQQQDILDGLEIELTESVILSQEKTGMRILEEIAEMGIQLSIDDFGTGYSNLSYLRKMPVKFLKIDRSFIAEIVENASDQMIVRSIISIGHSLGMQVIAEGVETMHQCSWLKNNLCDFIQGYLLTRPLPISRLESWIGDQKHPQSGTRLKNP
ncbi:MAG: EAL domain-containing protein [Marinospirillum sp.]|uniref:putative bifunctional diguanylate cyclase/phosphodiesterase n=1 Tax=Marinospirillum sp. TaxID=2183934 RepID=UPI0019DCF0C5|nr:EAL domain-containing protein [Marinospirillum sp.]MBE0506460.1 EAL domain-containing protein [Marinospirillum sp.]